MYLVHLANLQWKEFSVYLVIASNSEVVLLMIKSQSCSGEEP